jgi:thymidylate kinase
MAIFVLEGLPGTGKTRLLNDLPKKINLYAIDQIISNKPQIVISPGIFAQDFFFDNDSQKHLLAERISEKKDVLMDRCFLSTIAYNMCFKDAQYEHLTDALKNLDSRYSDRVSYIYIKISPEVSLQRKNKRMDNPEDLWSFYENLEKTIAFYGNFFSGKKNSIQIDGLKSYESVYSEIKDYILAHSKK